MINQQLILMR